MVIFIKNCNVGFSMNMKRFLTLGILGLFLFSMMGGVFANPFTETFSSVKSWGAENLKFTDLSANSGDYVGWVYAILLGMVIFSVISTFFVGSPIWVQWTITGSVTFLAMVGIPMEAISSFAAGYGAMGAAILAIIPFAIIFWFSIKVDSLALAKGTWVFFALYYLTFSVVEWNKATGEGAWYYFIGFVGACFMFFFIGLFRKEGNQWALEGEIEQARTRHNQRVAALGQFDKTIGDVSGIDVKPKKKKQ